MFRSHRRYTLLGMNKTIISIFLSALILHAQTLTLESCIDKALKSHPDVKQFLLETNRQQEGVKSAKSAWMPQISAYGEYDLQHTYVMPQNGAFHTIDDDGWAAGVSLRQKVYDFSKTAGHVEASKIRHEISRLSLEEARALMRYRVRNAYALVLVQKEAMRSRRKDLEAKKAMYEQATALVKQGLKTRADESRFLSSVRQAEDNLAQSVAAYEKALVALEQLIGEEIPSTASFDETPLKENIAAPLGSEKEIVEKNPGLRIAKESVGLYEATYRSAKAEHFGSVDIVADASHFDTLSRYDSTLLGIRYAVPIYSGGRLTAQAQQARIDRMIASEAEASRRRELLQEVRSIRADLRESDKRIEAREAQLLSAVQTKELVEARYREGLSTYMEVLDAEAMWLDAKLGLLAARYNKLERTYRMEYLNGQ